MATLSKTFSMLILMLICTTRKRNVYFINVKTRNPIKRLLEVISCSLILKKNPKRFQEETIVLKLDSPVLYEMFRHTHTHTHTSHLLMLVFTLALFPGFFFSYSRMSYRSRLEVGWDAGAYAFCVTLCETSCYSARRPGFTLCPSHTKAAMTSLLSV